MTIKSLIGRECSNRHIARLLGVSEGTVRTAIFCIDLGRVVGRRSDGVERAARVGEAGCVASGVVERPGARFGLEGDAEGLARTHQSHRG